MDPAVVDPADAEPTVRYELLSVTPPIVFEVVLTLEMLPPIEIVAFELPYIAFVVPVAVRMAPAVVLPCILYAGPVIPVGPVGPVLPV